MNIKQKNIVAQKRLTKLFNLLKNLYRIGSYVEIHNAYRYFDNTHFKREKRLIDLSSTANNRTCYALVVDIPQHIQEKNYNAFIIKMLVNDTIQNIEIMPYMSDSKSILNKIVFEIKNKFKIIG